MSLSLSPCIYLALVVWCIFRKGIADRGNFQVMRDYRFVNGARKEEGAVNTLLRPMDEDSDMIRILL